MWAEHVRCRMNPERWDRIATEWILQKIGSVGTGATITVVISITTVREWWKEGNTEDFLYAVRLCTFHWTYMK